MASALLENLTAASTLAASDLFPVKQAGARLLKATGTQLLALVGTAYVPLAGGTMTGALTIASGTLTASAPALSITQTWNNAAVAFSSLSFNITRVTENGLSTFLSATTSAGAYLYFYANGGVWLGSSSAGNFIDTTGVSVGSGLTLGFSSTANGSGTFDVALRRDAAATLAQRNGTTAQTLRVYRSYTDGSNYSRFTHGWNTSTALLMAEGLGTGTDGNIAFNDAALATGATLGYIMVPSAAGVSTGVPADIPTGQTPIVFDSTNKKIGAYTGGAWVWTAALA